MPGTPHNIPPFHNGVLLYNPAAGFLRRNPKYAEQAATELRAAGHEVTLVPTEGPRSAGSIAADQIRKGADLILVAGGDGTINEALSGMVNQGVPLAVLPAGTANVLASEMGLSRNVSEAILTINHSVLREVAVGRLLRDEGEARYFLLMAGIGFDAEIVYSLNLELKARLGKLAYWISSWSQVARRLREFEIEADGVRYRTSFVLASRVSNYGGDLEICRGAHLLSGDFEVVVLEGEYVVQYLRYFAGIITGGLGGIKGAHVLRAQKLYVTAPSDTRVHLQVDGEYAGRLPAAIDLVPNGLTLLMPPSYCEKLSSRMREASGRSM